MLWFVPVKIITCVMNTRTKAINPNHVPLGEGLGFIVYLRYGYFDNGVEITPNAKPRKRKT